MEIGSGREGCRFSTAVGIAESGVAVDSEPGAMSAGGVAGGVVVMDKDPHPASATATPIPSQNIRWMLVKLFAFIGSPPH